MKAFFDTNVLVAAVVSDEQRSTTAVRLLNEIDEGHTSILNVMELRSVLSKKKAFERERIDRIEDRIARKTTVTFPDASDIVAANQLQSETLLYPMDALILTSAESIDSPLVSFDAELVEHGAIEPEELL
ncbi:type II toxin-antitoxin system VapC family toxin [Halalkalicoccus ordinarius]|uniref:type II toxin-antitoxin system VapC family toxin n=1 Tax=Halalkalicoccus ordinarius TaxID=3116651 RepID=UPI00300EF234